LETGRKEKMRLSPKNLERWDIYSHEWRDGIHTAMNERDLRRANGTIGGNGIWKTEGVARRFKTALYTGCFTTLGHNCRR
jgi:hypothetical protein